MPTAERRSTKRAAVLTVFVAIAALPLHSRSEEATRRVDVAVVVNAANPVSGMTFDEMAAHLRLEKQFWQNGRRVVLILPPAGSIERRVLLERVYHMTDAELRKYWTGKLFAGEVPALPSVAPNPERATAIVGQLEGAMSIVRKTSVSQGVRIVTIDGRQPGDEGYPLVGGDSR